MFLLVEVVISVTWDEVANVRRGYTLVEEAKRRDFISERD